ncbi:MAG: GGDEF domain-containing protein [Treponema sp.]|nr:GGDEF domain-containing protein [Treponema sp.]
MKLNGCAALFRKFCLGMEDRHDLENIQSMIVEYNYKMLKFCSLLFSIIFAVISSISFTGATPVYEFPIVYVIMFIISMGIYLLARFVFKPNTNGRTVLLTFYILEVIGYGYGFYTGIVHGPFPAVTFTVMLIVLPTLPCDCPYRGNILMAIVSVIFLLFSRKVKGPYMFSNDLINVISYVLVSLFLHTHQQMSRMDDFKNRRIVKIQRDTDSMTGAMTKAAFESNTIRYLRNTEAEGCLLILDIDNFKSINDSFGHSIGDFFIANTGRCILDCCRASDFVGRFGGDEFVILMQGKLNRDTVQNKIMLMTDSLKSFFKQNTKYSGYSISVGCTLFHAGNIRPDYQELFNQADHALYVAKNSGKDKCIIHGE